MGLELVDVEELQAVRREDLAGGQQREVREVLVVDRVELVALDQAQEMRDLDRGHAVRARARCAMPPTKSLRSGTWAMTLLATSRSAAPALGHEPAASSRPKNSTIVSMPFSTRDRRDVGGGLDAERRDPPRHHVLEQVAVVARDLHHETVLVEPEALDRHVDVLAGVRDPRVGVRGEIRVLAEDRVGGDKLLELHEQAGLADLGVQRIERLHRVHAIRRHIALAQAATCRGRRRCAEAPRRRSGR